jgi:hypothetical protein
MQILAAPNSPYGNATDRSFKTVTAAVRFILRSYFVKGGVARHVEYYLGTSPMIQIDFTQDMALVLTRGNIDGWQVGEEKTLTQALILVKDLHKEG